MKYIKLLKTSCLVNWSSSKNDILKKKYGTYVQYIKAILNFDNSNPLATTEEIERITKELY